MDGAGFPTRTLKSVGLDHPTPAHVRGSVLDALFDAARARGEFVPQWVQDAVFAGVRAACAEHDAARIV